MDLPDKVIAALNNDGTIKAIKLLRKEQNLGLKEAREMIDAYQQQLQHAENYFSHPSSSDLKQNQSIISSLPVEVVEILLSGKKIEAIKLLRQMQGLSLADAKERVEEFDENKHYSRHSANTSTQHTRQG